MSRASLIQNNFTSAGLAPEAVLLSNASQPESEMRASPSYYIMRPETVESFFYLWRVTGDQQYRDWGWMCALATGQ